MIYAKKYNKYVIRGADYHYQRINKRNLLTFNAYLSARYEIIIHELVNFINSHFSDKKTVKILDVGCGDGVFIYLLSRKLKNYHIQFFGIDSSKEALEIAKKKIHHGTFIKSDVGKLPFHDSLFDIVISSDVIEHLALPNKMLNEIKRVSKKNAYIIIGTPRKVQGHIFDHLHFHEYEPKELFALLDPFFCKISICESHPLFWFDMYQKKIRFMKYIFTPIAYLINLVCLFGFRNPFLTINKNNNYRYTYMFALCQNDK